MTQWQPQYQPRRTAGQPPATPPQWQQDTPQRQYRPPQFQPAYQPQYQPPQYQPPQPPSGRHAPPPRRGYGPWIAVCAVVLLAVAGGGYYLLHGQGAPQTCAQQYAAWKGGPGAAGAKAIEADASALSTAGNTSDIKDMDTALGKIGTDAAADEAYPMPACADPAGYWPQALAEMKAAGDNASVTPGLGGLLTAEAPLKPLPGIEDKLKAELERTTAAG